MAKRVALALTLLGVAACGSPASEPAVSAPNGSVRLSGVADAIALAVDETRVYVETTQSVVSIPKAGGAPTELMRDTTAFFSGPLVVHDSRLYFGGDDGVLSVSVDGGDASIVPGTEGCSSPFALNDEAIYCAPLYGTPGFEVLRVSLVDGSAAAVVPSDEFLGAITSGIAIDAEHLYWTDGKRIQRAGLEGAAPEVVLTGLWWASNLTVNGARAYYLEDQKLHSMALDGSDPDERAAVAFSLDASALYWADQDLSAIHSAPLDDSASTRAALAPGDFADLLALDATSVFFVTNAAEVRVLPKSAFTVE